MLIGHLADLHVLEPDQKLGGVVDTNTMALRAVEALNRRSPQPDAVVVTGDLTHHGRVGQMNAAREILDRLAVPFYVLPGSHDDFGAFKEAFGDLKYFENSEEGQYIVRFPDTAIVVLNTSEGKGSQPALSDRRMKWARSALEALDGVPTIVAMHHPPFQCRIPVSAYIKDPTMLWARELENTIRKAGMVKLILCGHVHRSIQSLWADTLVSVGPATCVQADPYFAEWSTIQLGDKRTAELLMEPAAYQLAWLQDGAFSVYTLAVEEFRKF